MVNSPEWLEEWRHWNGDQPIGKYAHMCPDWDYLPIDETDDEIVACLCFQDSKEYEELKDKAHARIMALPAYDLGGEDGF